MHRFILLTWVMTLMATTAWANSYRNFSLSCSGVGLFHNFFLEAECCHPGSDGEDAQARNRLDLTMCIGMDQMTGRLQWDIYGKFSNYCTNCTILEPSAEADPLLTCFCNRLVGGHGPIKSTLNLDEGISNDMGILKCAGGKANLPFGSG